MHCVQQFTADSSKCVLELSLVHLLVQSALVQAVTRASRMTAAVGALLLSSHQQSSINELSSPLLQAAYLVQSC
jgi:hypothetical protein